MTTSDPTGGDKVVYFGVININENGRTVGSVDIWRSLLTKEMFCEEKRLGILQIADYIGMPKIDKDKKWAVARMSRTLKSLNLGGGAFWSKKMSTVTWKWRMCQTNDARR